MADDTKRRDDDDDLEKEIAEALGEQSVLEIATGELMPATSRRAGEPSVVTPGRFAEGVVAGIGEQDVFIEFGPRVQGVVPRDHFTSLPAQGDPLRVFVEDLDEKESLYLCSLRRTAQAGEWEVLEVGSLLVGEVKAVNRGGLELQCGVLTAFLPASHVSLERIEDLESLVGQRYEVEVLEIDAGRRRLVVSRRGLLARERDARRSEIVDTLQAGAVVPGKVTRIERFGAFVDLGGVEGLLHVSEMAWVRVEDPATQVSVGEDLKVQILKVEEGGKRISLSRKALLEDPWLRFSHEHPPGAVLQGTVTRIASYGAFIEVSEGIEGLAHISQLSPGPINTPKDVVRVGQGLAVRVVDVDLERRRIGLSLLTERGDRLTDDVADDETIREVLRRRREEEEAGEPTLGDLLKKALEGGQEDAQA